MSKRNIWILRIVLIIAIGLAFWYFSDDNKPKRIETDSTKYEVPFKKEGVLFFISAEGDTIREMDVEIADTEEQRIQGLMYRGTMSDRQTMLFIFPEVEQRSFWMKNTYISLDILFANADGTINTIQRNTQPYSEKQVPSYAPSKYVIEVIAGFCDLYGVKEGDRFTFEKMKN